MKHETQHHIGYNSVTERHQTKEITPSINGVYLLDRKKEGNATSFKRQETKRTTTDATHAFLRTTFLPKLSVESNLNNNFQNMERDFYSSLSNLSQHYKIEPMETECFEFPYNIAIALWDTRKKLRVTEDFDTHLRIYTTVEKAYLVTAETYCSGDSLYYVPVVPLYCMLKKKEQKAQAMLLLSVFSFLYHIVEIPFYRNEECFLFDIYEIIKEELDDDNEPDLELRTKFLEAEVIGDLMGKKLYNPKNLDFFKKRISSFECKNKFDEKCLGIAKKAFEIFEQFPGQSIFRNAYKEYEETDDDETGEYIHMKDYISFVSHTNRVLKGKVLQEVNFYFQNWFEKEEPTLFSKFDKTKTEMPTLDFEVSIFSLLEELIEFFDTI